MSGTKSIFDSLDENTEDHALAKAEAEIKAEKGVTHQVVREWLQQLVQGKDVPPPCK